MQRKSTQRNQKIEQEVLSMYDFAFEWDTGDFLALQFKLSAQKIDMESNYGMVE